MLRTFSGHKAWVTSVAFSPDGQFIATGSGDRTAKLWDVTTGAELRTFSGHRGEISSVAFSPDGRFILTSGFMGGEAKLWDIETGKEFRTLHVRGWLVRAIAFLPDAQHIITGSQDETARLWDLANEDVERTFTTHSTHAVSRISFSPDGRFFITALAKRACHFEGPCPASIALWDTTSGAVSQSFSGHPHGISAVAVSADSRLILSGSWDRTAKLWNVETGSELRTFSGHRDEISSVALSPDSRFALTGSLDRAAKLWDVATGTVLRTLAGHSASVRSVAFSPDGRLILTASDDRTAKLWDAASGLELRSLVGHSEGVRSAAFSPDGRLILTASDDRTAKLWDAASGLELRSLEGVRSAAFSSDGQLILTGSSDGTAKVWDAATAVELQSFPSGPSPVFSPDDRFVLSGGTSARLWDRSTGKEACRLISFPEGWAVVDPEKRFDASNGGDIEGLHWVAGMEPIRLSQLKDRYYDPGLLAKILGFKKEPLREVETFTDVALYPDIDLEAPSQDSSTMSIDLRNQGGGLGRVTILINGKEIATDARGSGFDSDAEQASIALDLSRNPYIIPGAENKIEVKAYNAEGYLVSRGESVTWQAPGEEITEAAELWLVVAGISDYSGDALDLKLAAKDAAVFAEALQTGAHRLFGTDKVHLTTLTTDAGAGERRPTRDNLVMALHQLANAKPTDVVLIYLAGHGVTHGGQDGDYYFLTQRATSFNLDDPAVRSSVALSSDELTELIKLTPANKQVLILDTCGSGRVVERLTETRGVPSSQIRALDRMKDRMGLFILAGSAADAVSYEASAYGQGLLTYSLLEGMRGAALRADEFVDVSQWFSYSADRVPAIAENIGGIQRPLVAMPRSSGSFDVARLLEEDRASIELKQPLPFMIRAMFLRKDLEPDRLDLNGRINAALRDVSARGRESPWVFVDTPEYADGYRLRGLYSVDETMGIVVVDVSLARDDDKLGSTTVTGSTSQIESLVADIVSAAEDML